MAINVIMLQNNVYRNDPRQYVFQSKLRSRKELIRYFGDLTLESENNNNALNDNQNFYTSNENYNKAVHDNENDNTSNDIHDIISVATAASEMS